MYNVLFTIAMIALTLVAISIITKAEPAVSKNDIAPFAISTRYNDTNREAANVSPRHHRR